MSARLIASSLLMAKTYSSTMSHSWTMFSTIRNSSIRARCAAAKLWGEQSALSLQFMESSRSQRGLRRVKSTGGLGSAGVEDGGVSSLVLSWCEGVDGSGTVDVEEGRGGDSV